MKSNVRTIISENAVFEGEGNRLIMLYITSINVHNCIILNAYYDYIHWNNKLKLMQCNIYK